MNAELYLYNTASREKEPFEPSGDDVTMYCCGPTVYNYAHIGNLRTYVFEDVLRRTLELLGHSVKHVVNITDVGHLVSDADSGEDKMEKGARREGRTVWDIAAHYTEAFMNNIRDLNVVDPTHWPKATDHITEMIGMVQALEKNGLTYRTSDGIYFDTSKFPQYANFAHIDPESLEAGARVDMGDKRHSMDFALWKFSPADAKRQMEWESPWGTGFPGWHIECSAMALKYLGQPIDIHCGGTDHVRVHHTNEIAQVEGATGKPFVRYWLHGEFLVLDKGKMAKSTGNFVTLETVKEQGIDPLAYRMFCYSSHYRNPLTFSWESLRSSAQSLKHLRQLVPQNVEARELTDEDSWKARFDGAVLDDLNIPKALGVLWEALRADIDKGTKRALALYADRILGLSLGEAGAGEWTSEVTTPGGKVIRFISSSQVESNRVSKIAEMIEKRTQARKSRDFAVADELRDRLVAEGVTVKDLPDGTTECVVE